TSKLKQMLKRKRRNNNSHICFTILLATAIIMLSSCENLMCSKKLKDKRALNEYFVEIDTCNQFGGYTHHTYFRNDGIFMAGYGDRLIKQGKWKYYYKKEKVAEGMFKDGIPIGSWKYKYVNDATWKVVKSKEDNFEVSIPSSWIQEKDDNPKF